MRRVISVIVLAFVMTEATGIKDASLAREQTQATGQERRAAIARRLSQMDLHSHLKIELTDDTTVDGFLVGVSSDSIVVDRMANHRDKNDRRTIAIADIAKVDKAKSLTNRILI
jgi:ABC-type phosphate/phosphonate transport system ATPase subunit